MCCYYKTKIVLVHIYASVSCDIIIFLALPNEAGPPCDLDVMEKKWAERRRQSRKTNSKVELDDDFEDGDEYDNDLEEEEGKENMQYRKIVTKVKDVLGAQV